MLYSNKEPCIVHIIKIKNLNFDIQLPKKIITKTDSLLLERLLKNLLSNAIKYTLEGNILFKVETIDNKHHVSITDTGIGIKQEDQSLIFDEFYQVDNQSIKLLTEDIDLTIKKPFFVVKLSIGTVIGETQHILFALHQSAASIFFRSIFSASTIIFKGYSPHTT